MAVSKNDVLAVKGQGFLQNRGTDCFSGRIVPAGCVFSGEDLEAVALCAKKFGNGKIAFTSRLAAEIVGIPFEKIPEAKAFMAERNLYFGGTGAKIRPITACKGTTCVYGNFDTQALAKKIHEDYYVGWADVKLPHKFKIGIGGCPNSCVKPSLNDFGIEGHRVPLYNKEDCRGCTLCQVEFGCPSKAVFMAEGKMNIDREKCRNCGVCIEKCPFKIMKSQQNTVYQIYVGGTWGKHCRMGTPLPNLVSESEIFPILEGTMLWFQKNGEPKERLGMAIDRLGFDRFCSDIFD
ncbi:MAG: 4Fe-4S binding protein [Oscillospiraceae bacterium]